MSLKALKLEARIRYDKNGNIIISSPDQVKIDAPNGINLGTFTFNGATVQAGADDPEGLKTAPNGSLYIQTSTVPRLLQKTGNGNTGWGLISGTGNSGGGVSDHGNLTGLGDDDHTQYFNIARGDNRYVQTSNLTVATDLADGLMSAADKTKLDDNVLTDITAGTNITIDKTNPNNPIINASSGGGSGSGWTELHNSTASFTTSKLITGLPDTANEVKILLKNINTSGGQLQLQLGTSGGIVTTGYSGSVVSMFEENSAISGTASSFSANFLLHDENSSQERDVTITLSRFSGNTWVYEAQLNINSGNPMIATGNGEITLSGVLERLQLILGSVYMITSGSIRVAYK